MMNSAYPVKVWIISSVDQVECVQTNVVEVFVSTNDHCYQLHDWCWNAQWTWKCSGNRNNQTINYSIERIHKH